MRNFSSNFSASFLSLLTIASIDRIRDIESRSSRSVTHPPTGTDRAIFVQAREFFAESQPFASGGAYINFLTQDETDRVAFAYGGAYTRLGELKKKYDPTNLFRMNQNIKPV